MSYYKRKNLQDLREIFTARFFENQYHQWIKEDKYVGRCFQILCSLLPKEAYVRFLSSDFPVFLKSNGNMSCIITNIPNAKIILVFPELIKLLKSADPDTALAILAHELGHLYHGHGNSPVNYMKAQIEADDFAFEIGLGLELQGVLLEFNNIECQTRISYLASKHAAKQLNS